jgi:hypothetical protein
MSALVDTLRSLSSRTKKARRGVTSKGMLRWLNHRSKPLKAGERVSECSYLGDTLIALAGTYEGSQKDCEYVEFACNELPAMADALKRAADELDSLHLAMRDAIYAWENDGDGKMACACIKAVMEVES